MNLRQTIKLREVKATAAGTQATVPDSRSADAWIKNYLDKKQERLNNKRLAIDGLRKQMREAMVPLMDRGKTNALDAAWNVYKPIISEQKPGKIASGGEWCVTDPEGMILSTWKTENEAKKAAYAMYKGIAPSSTGATAGARVQRVRDVVRAGGQGSGCQGPNCGRHKVVRISVKNGLGWCSTCGKPAMAFKQSSGKYSLRHTTIEETIERAKAKLPPAQIEALKKKYGVKSIESEEEDEGHEDIFQDQELNDRRRRRFIKHPKPPLVREADELRMGDRRPSSHGQGSAGTGGTGGPSSL